MSAPDPHLSDVSLRNWQRIQGGYERMILGKAIEIEGVQFRFKHRASVEGDSAALGIVLVGCDQRGEWLPAHG